ncbi:MAG: Uncharacterised protein [Hyphomonas sp. TMED17]|nr:MAG: Uncharacterised protein [Hyphomonas sp. TMED17]
MILKTAAAPFYAFGVLCLSAFSPMAAAQSGLSELDQQQRGESYVQTQQVTLRALDKIIGRYTDFVLNVGEPKIYGSLLLEVDVCFQRPPEEPPESAAFLRISSASSKRVKSMAVPRLLDESDRQALQAGEAESYFSGWMFASSPGLSGLEHAVYDVWVINCVAVLPDTPAIRSE